MQPIVVIFFLKLKSPELGIIFTVAELIYKEWPINSDHGFFKALKFVLNLL